MQLKLADRLGKTWHVSPLEKKLERLRRNGPAIGAEEWLLKVANARGATVVFPPHAEGVESFEAPSRAELSDVELLGGILLLSRRDEPQLLRAAAQLIGRGVAEVKPLLALAERERFGPVLKELARLALRIDPDHRIWSDIFSALEGAEDLRQPLLHWTRLAEPRMRRGMVNAERWELIV